jgi:hypothetical protein
MRILDLYIGRFFYSSASTIFITLTVFIGAFFSGMNSFIEQARGY